jgi:acyl-CoA thioester hydrolase
LFVDQRPFFPYYQSETDFRQRILENLMARIKIDMPGKPIFTCTIPIRITDVNYGGHVGNDSLLSILHEARVQFLHHYGFTEQNVGGKGIIMSDAALVYKAEIFYGDTLTVEIGVNDIQRHSADITYRVLNKGTEVAQAKTGIVFFDYGEHKITSMPPEFRDLLSRTT